jgi:hypothetical protein
MHQLRKMLPFLGGPGCGNDASPEGHCVPRRMWVSGTRRVLERTTRWVFAGFVGKEIPDSHE